LEAYNHQASLYQWTHIALQFPDGRRLTFDSDCVRNIMAKVTLKAIAAVKMK
jgi:hypothetical protein